MFDQSGAKHSRSRETRRDADLVTGELSWSRIIKFLGSLSARFSDRLEAEVLSAVSDEPARYLIFEPARYPAIIEDSLESMTSF